MSPLPSTPHGQTSSRLFRWLIGFQGLYYLATGLWPLVSMETFLMVTGPKTDLWLVRTVGILITVMGMVFLTAAYRGRPTVEATLLAVGAAVGLTAVDVVYVMWNVIDPIYLLDAAGELALLAVWTYFMARQERARADELLPAR